MGLDWKGRAGMVDIPRFSGSAPGGAFTSVYVAIGRDLVCIPPATLVEGLPCRWPSFGWLDVDWSLIFSVTIVNIYGTLLHARTSPGV